tara:strand:- start:378 stop:878 length:501 start_codon:yes stop_codon:yes gene_type:complete
VKLKELINEVVIDKKVQDEIDELGELSKEISNLKIKLLPLQKKYGDIVKSVIPTVEKLNKETIKSNHYVMWITKKGFERETVSYKSGMIKVLEKVNANTKVILLSILDETKKLTHINPTFTLSPIKSEGIGNKLKVWWKNFQRIIKRFAKNFKNISDGNKMLKRLV